MSWMFISWTMKKQHIHKNKRQISGCAVLAYDANENGLYLLQKFKKQSKNHTGKMVVLLYGIFNGNSTSHLCNKLTAFGTKLQIETVWEQ